MILNKLLKCNLNKKFNYIFKVYIKLECSYKLHSFGAILGDYSVHQAINLIF